MFDFGDNVDRDKLATKCKFDFVDRVDGRSIPGTKQLCEILTEWS